MTVYDGTDEFTGSKGVSSARLNKTVLWRGIALPVGAANKIPQNGLFFKTDSGEIYEQTSADISSPNFVLRTAGGSGVNQVVAPHNTTPGDYPELTATPAGYFASSGDAVYSSYAQKDATNGFMQVCSNCTATRFGVKVLAGSSLIGKKIKTVTMKVDVVAEPFNATMTVRDSIDTVKATKSVLFDLAPVSDYTFSFDNAVLIAVGDRILVEFTGGSSGGQRLRMQQDAALASPTGFEHTSFQASAYVDEPTDTAAFSFDSNLDKVWQSDSENTPNITTDFGSVGQTVSEVKLNFDTVVTTETQFIIEISSDDISYTKIRTVNVSDFVNGVDGFVRFNINDPTKVRFMRIKGVSNAVIIKMNNPPKWLIPTQAFLAIAHDHKEISTTDASIPLEG